MAAQVLPSVASPPAEPQSVFSENLKRLAEIVAQTAFRVLFIGVAILTAAAAFPISLHAVVIPTVAFGATILASFFFEEASPVPPPQLAPLPPLIRVVAPPAPMPSHIPLGAPRGLHNSGQNCAFNAVIQFLKSDPAEAHCLDCSAAYDAAVGDNLAVAAGVNSQALREALFPRISSRVQMDAAEIMATIVDLLPDDQKMSIITTRHWNETGLSPMADPLQPQTERTGYLSLPLNKPTLEGMLKEFMDHLGDDPVTYVGVDGNPHAYPIDRETIQFVEAPPALRLQIKRFNFELPAPPTFWNRWFPLIFPPPEGRVLKNAALIEVPPELDITLVSGAVKRYQLVSFVNHKGASANHGHYTAARIVNGQKYFIDDEVVTLANPAEWDARLQQAYLLCYLPVPQG